MILRKLSILFMALVLSACAADGSFYEEGKNTFNLGQTLLRVGGVALLSVPCVNCGKENLAKALVGLPPSAEGYLTGGPYFEWDEFKNGQFRCRNISNGQFEYDSHCSAMPKDDDRWPN